MVVIEEDMVSEVCMNTCFCDVRKPDTVNGKKGR